MPDRIDLATKSRELLEDEQSFSLKPTDLIARAQAYATLALVEQQRIANRIALAAAVAEEQRHYVQHGARANLIGPVGIFDNPDTEHGQAPLLDDIRLGLGL